MPKRVCARGHFGRSTWGGTCAGSTAKTAPSPVGSGLRSAVVTRNCTPSPLARSTLVVGASASGAWSSAQRSSTGSGPWFVKRTVFACADCSTSLRQKRVREEALGARDGEGASSSRI
eukprot:1732422-Pleurochrysis_carterae.AAC.1